MGFLYLTWKSLLTDVLVLKRLQGLCCLIASFSHSPTCLCIQLGLLCKLGSAKLFFSFFLSHTAFWNLCEVIIPACVLCCLELLAVLSWEEHCRFPTGPNKTAFSLWESDLCFFISPKLEAILILQSLFFTDLDSDFNAYCCGREEKKKALIFFTSASHVFFLGSNPQTYCTETLQRWGGDKAGRKEAAQMWKI